MSKQKRAKRLQRNPDWHINVLTENPVFSDIVSLIDQQLPENWPDLDWFNRQLKNYKARHNNARQKSNIKSFIEQTTTMTASEYERQIATSLQIPTRLRNWHDFFNAITWLLFPQIKQQLNQLHLQQLAHQSSNEGVTKQRSPQRDFITLIDESSIIIACSSSHYRELNRQHHWQKLFIHHRADWGHKIRPFVIGHGLYEQCLMPYIGLTGKAFYWQVSDTFFDEKLSTQYEILDQEISIHLAGTQRLDSRELLPMPVLGIPGWYAANIDEDFYTNEQYFRPAPQR